MKALKIVVCDKNNLMDFYRGVQSAVAENNIKLL